MVRGSRSSSRATLTRERRGSIIVWVGVMATALVAFGAMAVDFGSFYVTSNELHTMTDASALAGARALQLSTADDPKADVDAAARAMAAKNGVMGVAASIDGGNVTLGYWNDGGDPGELEALDGRRSNAVQVVDSAQTEFIFGNVFANVWDRLAPNIPRRSVAWSANVSGATCVRPLGFSVSNVLKMLGLPPRDLAAEPLTDDEVKRFNELPESARTFIANPPQNGMGHPSVPIAGYQPYSGLALGGPGGGKPEYQRQLAGSECQTSENSVDLGDVYDQPSAMTPRFTTEVFVDGVQTGPQADRTAPLCTFENDANQTCGPNGVRFPAAFGAVPGEFGRSDFQVDMLADVTIKCYVRGQPGPGGAEGEPQGGASCGTAPWNDVSAYTGGTVVGVIEPNLSFRAGELKYSNTPSISKQLILVR